MSESGNLALRLCAFLCCIDTTCVSIKKSYSLRSRTAMPTAQSSLCGAGPGEGKKGMSASDWARSWTGRQGGWRRVGLPVALAALGALVLSGCQLGAGGGGGGGAGDATLTREAA